MREIVAHTLGCAESIASILSEFDPAVVAPMTRTEYSTSLDPKLHQPLIDVGSKFGMLQGPVNGATLIVPGFR
jgi:hypothetical protein